MTNDKRPTSVYLPVRISQPQSEQLEQLARQTKKTKSQLIRNFIDKGLSIDNFETDEQRMLLAIRKAVALELEHPVERLAAIGAKGTHMSAASFLMLVQTMKLLTTEDEQSNVDKLAMKSRRLAVEYLKAKSESVDSFVEDALHRMKT